MSLKSSLRLLVAEYGFAKMNESLREIMVEDYTFLKGYFESGGVPTQSAADVAPTPFIENVSIPEKDVSLGRIIKVRSKKQMHSSQAPAPAPVPAPAPAPAPVPETEVSVAAENTVVSDEDNTTKVIHVERKEYRDPKEIKKWQKDQEEKKHAEMVAAGVGIEQILTKESLKQWIEVEGRTFSWVAREKAGCPDSQVAAAAKMFGIQSTKGKQRINMIANKKH